MGTVLASIAWWGPLAIVAGAAAGLLVAYLVLVFAGGSPTGSPILRRLAFERTEKTNYPTVNPAAFLVVLGAIGLIAGLSIALSR